MAKKHRTVRFPFIFMVFALGLAGCFSPTKYSESLADLEVEAHYGDIAMTGDVRDRWWEAYGDGALNDFVELALAESPTLQVAYLRLLDSELAMQQGESDYYPDLNFTAGVGYGGNVSENSKADPSYSLGLSLSYEVDLWGKVRAQKRVNELSMLSLQDSAETAAMTLVGNVVTQWFTIQYYGERRALIARLLEVSENYYALVQDYFRSGQSDAMDVLEQRQQLETLRSNLNEIDSNIRIARHALSILAGGKAMPEVSGPLPDAIDIGGTVDASKLIEMRPDLRSALRSAQKADAQIVIAIANRLPTLRLSASLSFRASDIADLFLKMLWDLAANFSASIFDGFQKSIAIDRARVSYISERFNYINAVSKAVAEVEEAILKLRVREQALADARAQLERQKEILEVSRTLFVNGSVAYNRVLSALRSMISAAQSELEARRALLNAQVDLFKSMGGAGWLKDRNEAGLKRARELLEKLGDEDEGKKENHENES